MLAVSARVQLGSLDDANRFCELAAALVEPTRQEKGCTLYAMARDLVDDCVVWISEEWDTEEDLNNHLTADHITHFLNALADVDVVSMDDKKYVVASVGRVELPGH